ncbi:MAG: endonuclease IV [Candidatus Aenigmatarchaeota archaeon]|nr:MAG: endonuclease IV [Candidatus Aenigmarchaeota archaeon]
MKIFLGPAGIPTISKPDTISGIESVAKLGLNAMEVEFVQGVRMGNELAKQAGKVAEEHRVRLSIHAPYFINLCNEEKAQASMKRILDSCERGYYMNASVVVFHPGYYGGMQKDKAYEMVKQACIKMVDEIERRGWNIKLGLETTGKHTAFGTLEENIRIAKEVKGCEVVVDFAHLYARAYGKINYSEIFDKLSKLSITHLHTHFSGIEFTMKGEKNHTPINNNPPFEPLAKEIVKRKLNITIISESPILEQDSLKMKKVFEGAGIKI